MPTTYSFPSGRPPQSRLKGKGWRQYARDLRWAFPLALAVVAGVCVGTVALLDAIPRWKIVLWSCALVLPLAAVLALVRWHWFRDAGRQSTDWLEAVDGVPAAAVDADSDRFGGGGGFAGGGAGDTL